MEVEMTVRFKINEDRLRKWNELHPHDTFPERYAEWDGEAIADAATWRILDLRETHVVAVKN